MLENYIEVKKELSLIELQQLMIEGKITTYELIYIIIESIGCENFMRIIQETIDEVYEGNL